MMTLDPYMAEEERMNIAYWIYKRTASQKQPSANTCRVGSSYGPSLFWQRTFLLATYLFTVVLQIMCHQLS